MYEHLQTVKAYRELNGRTCEDSWPRFVETLRAGMTQLGLAAARNAYHVASEALHAAWKETLIYPNGFEPARVAP